MKKEKKLKVRTKMQIEYLIHVYLFSVYLSVGVGWG